MNPEDRLDGSAFLDSQDFTIGIEEEFQILDPETLALTSGFHKLMKQAGEPFKSVLKGELIDSEIEIETSKCNDFAAAADNLAETRRLLIDLARRCNYLLCSTGTHPFSPWQNQQIIDTPHYRLVEEELKYVAWRNNTFSFHVHVGIKGKDRAVKAADALRTHLPVLLAVSASSPFTEGRLSHLHSTRSQLFIKNFPRCGIPDTYGNWENYYHYLQFLFQSNSVKESTQIWWSVRPHIRYGTVEIRICDGQPAVRDTLAISALIYALTVRICTAIDRGESLPVYPRRMIEENFWRAIRHGLDGRMINLANWQEIPARVAVEQLLDWTAPLHKTLGVTEHINRLEQILAAGNTAQRLIQQATTGEKTIDLLHKEQVEATMSGL